MKKGFLSNLVYILFLGLGVYLAYWQIAHMSAADKEEFNHTLRNIDYRLAVPVIGLLTLGHVVRSLRWNILLRSLNYRPGLPLSFAAVMSGYFANTFVPRLGEVVRCTTLSRAKNYRVEQVLGTVIAERMFDLLSYGVLLLLTLLSEFNIISSSMKRMVSGNFNYTRLLLIIGGIVLLALGVRFLLRRYAHFHFFARVRTWAHGLADGIRSLWKMEQRWLFVGLTICMWALYLLQIFIGFKVVPGLAHIGFGASLAVLSLATLSMIITPGGLGSFPIFVMQVLLLYGIHSSVGKAFGWVIWGASTAFSLVVGLICFLLFAILNARQGHRGGGTVPPGGQ